MAAFLEIMEFLDRDLGLIDFIPDAALGGNFVNRPRVGQLDQDAERADVAGTLTTDATPTATTNTDETMVTLWRTLFHNYFTSTPVRGSIGVEGYNREIGRQIAIKMAQKLLRDIYNAGLASASPAALDHEHDVYVDNTSPASQVDFTPTVLQNAKFKMTDHQESLDIGVCNAKQWNDMRIDLISNDDFRVPNIVGDLIRGQLYRTILGVTFIVDDQIPTAAGPTGGSPVKQQALLFRSRLRNPLGEAPITVSFQLPLEIHEQHVLGTGQVRENQLQGQAAWALGFRGSKYLVGSGANPSDAALALGTNWPEANDDDEQHGIVSVITN